MRILCVAEKPSIAKSVAFSLSGGNSRLRKSSFNKSPMNYDFKFNFGRDLGECDVTMTAVFGHLTSIDFPPEFGWGKCPPERLFEASIFEKKSNPDVASNIAKEARNAQLLMIWTDCDREGEFIGYEVLSAASLYNRNLTLDNTLRAVFSHTQTNHIINAARNPVKLHRGSIDAVDIRRELDLRTGACFTRFLTTLYRGVLNQQQQSDLIVSYGGCQFPTLGFVVDRYIRVKEFVPQEFWHIDAETVKDDQKVAFQWDRVHLFDRLSAALLYENSFLLLKDRLRIYKVEQKPTSNYRPFPLTTVELQKNGSKFLKLSAKEMLDTAEKLYNLGYLSYPRTETDRFPLAMDLKDLVSKQTNNAPWSDYASSLLNDNGFRQPRAGSHDDHAHPPIHPIRECNLSSLNLKELKVYEFVVRHFLACCSEDAKGSMTNVGMRWGEETFHTSGLTVLERNYLDVYPYYNWNSSKALPNFHLDEEVTLKKVELKAGKTSPPNHITEPELIALMDLNGIGTDATIAEHIEKIISREYIVKQTKGNTKILTPTLLGMSLVKGFNKIGFDNISLSKPFLRKNLESKLTDIVEGRITKQEVKAEITEMYVEAFALTQVNKGLLVKEYTDLLQALQ